MKIRSAAIFSVLSVALLAATGASALQSPKATEHPKKVEASAAPSAQDIANAKSQGLVWANTNTRVYHKDGDMYGKTKHGKFVTEADAKKEGFREAKEPVASKNASSKKKDQSGLDSTIDTHSSTPPK